MYGNKCFDQNVTSNSVLLVRMLFKCSRTLLSTVNICKSRVAFTLLH